MTPKQHSRYSPLDYREELIQNIMGFEEYPEPATFTVHKPVGNFTTEYIFHNFLIQKGVVKYAIAKSKKK